MCVAGYVFSAEQCRRFDQEWLEVLEEFNLPYFRMSECAHASGAFTGRREICDPVARRMIGIIKRRAERGIITSVSDADFKKSVPADLQTRTTGPAYSWCVKWALAAVAEWIEKHSFDGTVSYFFESGHHHQAITNRILTEMFGGKYSEIEAAHRYCSHAFAGKTATGKTKAVLRALQAADLLAWQYRNSKLRQAKGQKYPRRDFQSLLECPTVADEWTEKSIRDKLEEIHEQVMKQQSGR